MRWTPGGTSEDIEDRRDEGGEGGGGGLGGRHIGIGGLLLLAVASVVFRRDLVSPFLGGMSSGPVSQSDPARSQAEQPMVEFVSFVIDDLQNTWGKTLPQQAGVPYRKTKMVLFHDYVDSACGQAEAATGPFYCPGDEKVYIDLGFYRELKDRFGAAGEFAQAYVIAHEVGHHVQKVLGIERKADLLRQRNPGAGNQISVRMELQADCFAGVWGHSTGQRNIIDQSDVESGLRAAAAIGDDRLQKMATGRVMPERFTHGSSAQRVEWFKRGLQEGDIRACDTFGQ